MNGKRILLALGLAVLLLAFFLTGAGVAQSRWTIGKDTIYGMMGGWGGEDMHADGNWEDHMGGWEHGSEEMMGTGHMNGMSSMMHGDNMMFGADMMAPGHMGGWGGLADVDPLAINQAEEALVEFLAELDDSDLTLGEIMVFENHAYAQILGAESGSGAFEVLVDPVSGNVYPEPGPNMMWNSEYDSHGKGMMGAGNGGMMGGGSGMMRGGHMGSYKWDNAADGEVLLDSAQVIERAQAYLDEALPGANADEHADAFPGYYTIHVLRGGQIVGMLSVNANSGEAWPHTWHGDFVETTIEHEE